MKSKAFSAIAAAAYTAGATSVVADGTTTVVVYKGSEIRIDLDMSVCGGWSVSVDGQDMDNAKAPSVAFKKAAKEIDRRRAREASDLEGLHNAAVDKSAKIVSIEAERVVMAYEGREVVAVKPALLWTASCEGEQLAHGAFSAWQVLKNAICTLEERKALVNEGADADELEPTTSLDEVRNVLNKAFQEGDIDHTTPVDELRETYRIDGAIENHEIREALALALRDDNAPMLVMSLGCDRVEVVVECEDTDEDPKAFNRAMAKVARELSDISGEAVILQRVGDHEGGDGVLRAYRAPRGDYHADDVEEVERFGVPCGRYRMLGLDALPTLTLPAWGGCGAYRQIDLPYDYTPMPETRVVSLWQSVAELRAHLVTMPVALHDEGPVQDFGAETWVDLDLSNGSARLSSLHDSEGADLLHKNGYTVCLALPAGTPGRRVADALKVAEARMPEVVAGWREGCGWGRLDTESSIAALEAICQPIEELSEPEREAA